MIDYKLVENCVFCEKSFKDVYKTKEHIIPKSKIPCNRVENYTSSCVWCNDLKRDRNAKEFALFLEDIIINYDEKYNYIKDYLKIMKNNAWKLYNKTHKSHKDFHEFFGIPKPKKTKKKPKLNSLIFNAKGIDKLLKTSVNR